MGTETRLAIAAGTLSVLVAAPSAWGATRNVGPGKTYSTPCAAIAAASPGDVVEIDVGVYNGEVCSWSTNSLSEQ